MSEIVIRHAEPKDYDAIRRPAGGVPQHATGSSSFSRNVASAANRASRCQTAGCLH